MLDFIKFSCLNIASVHCIIKTWEKELIMKWPELMLLIRHDVSRYNVLKKKKQRSSLYKRFLRAFKRDFRSSETLDLANEVKKKFSLMVGDADTELVDKYSGRACEVGKRLRKLYVDKIPDIIFLSPYERTKMTFGGLKRGWPELENVKFVEEERIREQEHGLSLIYNDWRVFHVLHPEQAELYKMEGPYWYRYPQGENVPDVRERNRSWMNTIVRDFAEKRIMAITHHLNILAVLANLERWGEDEFVKVDKKDKPINCGVTAYRGNPDKGKNGRFELEYYNRQFYRK